LEKCRALSTEQTAATATAAAATLHAYIFMAIFTVIFI